MQTRWAIGYDRDSHRDTMTCIPHHKSPSGRSTFMLSALDQSTGIFQPTGIFAVVPSQSLTPSSWAILAAGEEPMGMYGIAVIVGILVALVFVAVLGFFLIQYGKLWFQAFMSEADVKLANLIRMHFTKVNPNVIVQAKVMAAQAKLNISRKDGISTHRLEAHYLAGGNVMNVIHAIIAAHRAQIPLDFDQAAAIDLAGRDVLDAVQTSVYPKVIDCPDPKRSGKTTLSAITKNGIELRVRARVTVRTNIEQLIGGATEDTVIARVGEAIISSIGSAETHFHVLENPDMITRVVLSRALDAQTAFEIVSIDIADIDVGENIGARLQSDQAEADTRVARAQAERRRAEAIAQEQQMKARVSENRSRLVLAEAEVPKAMAEAFQAGRIGSTGSTLPMDQST
ncbi:hypothetical protein RSSM_00583 [Rhodopirellula sallentina SM41]|uniref:Flotillin-like protein FloA n=2 Tax=Rhodopirellula TaxID=265488 RepID=M5UPK9_9BACT|nr:hypothetical protein RSSM_00583 [Rhodopirellula sallentina SM41]